MKILYYCPTIIEPCGGVKQIYRHVDVLNKNGFDAAVVHSRKNFRIKWFDNNTKIVYSNYLAMKLRCLDMYRDYPEILKKTLILFSKILDLLQKNKRISEDTIFVLPDSFLWLSTEFFPNSKKIVFCQNHNYLLDKTNTQILDYINSNDNLIGFISVSNYITDFIDLVFPNKINLSVVNGVDNKIFSHSTNKKKIITYMPRKLKTEVDIVINTLVKRKRIGNWELVPIDNKSQTEVSDLLKLSRVFLSFNYLEGLGLPPIEALSCGAVVVGYTGQGGNEYFGHDFSIKIESHDLTKYILAIEELVKNIDTNVLDFAQVSSKASEFVYVNYSMNREEETIVKCWNKILNN